MNIRKKKQTFSSSELRWTSAQAGPAIEIGLVTPYCFGSAAAAAGKPPDPIPPYSKLGSEIGQELQPMSGEIGANPQKFRKRSGSGREKRNLMEEERGNLRRVDWEIGDGEGQSGEGPPPPPILLSYRRSKSGFGRVSCDDWVGKEAFNVGGWERYLMRAWLNVRKYPCQCICAELSFLPTRVGRLAFVDTSHSHFKVNKSKLHVLY